MSNLIAERITIAINNKMICQDLNLAIRPGDIWGLLGPNGCGKTTLLHALAGLHPLIEGDMKLDNHFYTTLSVRSIAQNIGILFQHFHSSFPQTVWEYCLTSRYPHLSYFKKESSKDKHIVMQALQLMALDPFMHKTIDHLSGGEKRRLAIATVLAQTPSIYLLDEPTNHLDVQHQMRVLNHFTDLAQNNTAGIMMALHDVNLAQQFCNRILLLFPDGCIQQGTANEMLTVENLTRLYQHPIKKILADTTTFWWAESKRC